MSNEFDGYAAKYRAKVRRDLIECAASRTGEHFELVRPWFEGRGNLDAPDMLPAGCASAGLRSIGAVVYRAGTWS